MLLEVPTVLRRPQLLYLAERLFLLHRVRRRQVSRLAACLRLRRRVPILLLIAGGDTRALVAEAVALVCLLIRMHHHAAAIRGIVCAASEVQWLGLGAHLVGHRVPNGVLHLWRNLIGHLCAAERWLLMEGRVGALEADRLRILTQVHVFADLRGHCTLRVRTAVRLLLRRDVPANALGFPGAALRVRVAQLAPALLLASSSALGALRVLRR